MLNIFKYDLVWFWNDFNFIHICDQWWGGLWTFLWIVWKIRWVCRYVAVRYCFSVLTQARFRKNQAIGSSFFRDPTRTYIFPCQTKLEEKLSEVVNDWNLHWNYDSLLQTNFFKNSTSQFVNVLSSFPSWTLKLSNIVLLMGLSQVWLSLHPVTFVPTNLYQFRFLQEHP